MRTFHQKKTAQQKEQKNLEDENAILQKTSETPVF